MRYARRDNGERRFNVEEFLTAQQIQSYFSSTAAKLKHAVTAQSGHDSIDDNEGYRMVTLNFNVLAKFGLCSNCSQKLDECSLARARKIFATARMLGFSLKFPQGKTH